MTNISDFRAGPTASASIIFQPDSFAKAAPTHTESGPALNKHDAQLSDSPELRATADAQIARPYAEALAARSYHQPRTVKVSSHSTLGRWRSQLDSAFKEPGFQEWARDQKLDTKSLTLSPTRGELTGIVDGRRHTFSLKDDSGWSDASRALLSTAKVIAPQPGQAFDYPWPKGEVSMITVGRFYGEAIALTPAQDVEHRNKLRKNYPFAFKPLPYAQQRSINALAENQKMLGNTANHNALVAALKYQVDDASGNIDFKKVRIPIDPRSSRFIEENRRDISVEELLQQENINVPINAEQARSLARALSFDLAIRAPGADAGGVTPIGRSLSKASLRKVTSHLKEWKAQQASKTSATQAAIAENSLLHLLMDKLPEAKRNLTASDPARALDSLIRSPEAIALGKALQEKIKTLDTPTSAIESVSAALVHELDPNENKSCFNLSGFNLYSDDNVGRSSAEIVKRFTEHLEKKVGIEAAPLAARLLLSAAAPEFLVADMPPNLVYGSHLWTNYCTEVARIERQLPGASANMTFSQVMAFGDTPLISSQDEIELAVAMFNPVIAWGTANDVIKIRPGGDCTEEDFSKARDALVKQQKELKWAYDALNAPPVTRRELALAEWNRVFPDIDPTRVLENVKLSGKRLSLIDAYMTGPAYLRLWVSLDNDKELSELLAPRVSQLSSNIDKEFSGKFEEYKRTHEAAMSILFKYHLSLQPKDIQQILQQPGVGFIEVSRPALYGNKLSRHGEAIPIANPTASQLEAVKGRHGLLMKIRGSDGKDSYYSYFPAQAKFVKETGFPGERTNENDLDYFGGNTDRVPGLYNTYKEFGLTNTEPDPPRDINGEGGTYSSSRAGNLGAMAAKFFMYNYDALKAEAAQATVIDEWNTKRERNKNFALSLIPFYDGIVDAIKGNVAGALFNIGFDIFGFILPGASAARKAFKAGKGVLNVIKAAVFSGIGNSFGVTDTANIFKNIGAGVKVGFKDLKYVVSNGPDILSRMRGSYRGYKVGGVYREGDIVKGFYRSPVDNLLHPVVATFKKGGWYAYNTITKTPFGPQILQFEILDAVIGKPDAQKFKPLTGHLSV